MTETVAAIIDDRLEDVLKAKPLEVERAWQELARIYRSQLRDHENRIAALERLLAATPPAPYQFLPGLGCTDRTSCQRHGMCMYLGCRSYLEAAILPASS